jgi:hypothetical protein
MAKSVKNSVLNKDSRYVNGGETFVYPDRLGWWDRFPMSPADDDIIFTITPTYVGRPDLLAQQIYGKSTLMWVVLQYNNIVDVNEEFVEGAQIRLPTFARLSIMILNKTTGGTPV